MVRSGLDLYNNRPFKPDLHTHTNASDGVLSPVQLVGEAHLAGVNLLAVTDHDTLSGVDDAMQAAKETGIGLIPGIELSTAGEDEVHILAYFVNPRMPMLTDLLKKISLDRQSRCGRSLERLNTLGITLQAEDLQIPPGTDCNRPHIGRALVRKGIVPSLSKAFDLFLAVDRPAYIPRIRLETEEIVQMLREEGSVPVLAHPGLIRNNDLKTPDSIARLKEAGLCGIESYHSKHSASTSFYWDKLARKYGLLVTGGSDFHQHGDDHGPIGCCNTQWRSADEDTARLMEMMPVGKKKGFQ